MCYGQLVVNVANLDREHFERFLSGAKRTEWRWRSRIDPRLEAVTTGEPLYLLEIGSSRAIEATVRAMIRFDYPAHASHVYAVRVADPRLVDAPGIRKIQGWHRRAAL